MQTAEHPAGDAEVGHTALRTGHNVVFNDDGDAISVDSCLAASFC